MREVPFIMVLKKHLDPKTKDLTFLIHPDERKYRHDG
jgi:hypothetical protein